jgi:flagellar biosynthesis/type III secretory pathway protein FliH
LKLDQETKDKHLKHLEARYEVYMNESYNKGYYKGKVEGIHEGIEVFSKSINKK